MYRKRIPFFIAALVALFVVIGLTLRAQAQNASGTPANTSSTGGLDLQTQLQQKEQQIAAINQQMAAAQANLKTVQSQKVTLQQQVNLLDGNINSLNLGIQSDQLTSQQLELQSEQLSGDLTAITASQTQKQQAIASILEQLEKNDTTNGNLLLVFLKQGSLADGVFEAQSLITLQGQLSTDIGTLKNLQGQYNSELQQSASQQASLASEQQDLQNKVAIVQDQQQQKAALLASTKNQESVFQKQLTALQQQQAQINSDIESIDAVLRTKINPSTLPALGPGVLEIPVQGDTEADITQGYGATAFAQTEYVHHWHNGLDFAASIGTPILAAESGVVAAEANEDLYCPHGAYGKFITINHYDGLTTMYGHLSKFLVTVGEKVTRGQIIAYSGNTGDVTGPHLHFTVFAQSTYYLANSRSCGPLPEGGDLDPTGYLF